MISKLETRKDTIQEGVESAASHAGRIATIVAGAVRDVAREVGDFATDLFEMREAARRAEADQPQAEPPGAARRAAADQPDADPREAARRPEANRPQADPREAARRVAADQVESPPLEPGTVESPPLEPGS